MATSDIPDLDTTEIDASLLAPPQLSTPRPVRRTIEDYSNWTFVPVSPFNRPPRPEVLTSITQLNSLLSRPLPKLDFTRPVEANPVPVEASPVVINDVEPFMVDLRPKLTILDDCVVFIDTWMSDGQPTSDIFAELAEELGAKTINKLDSTCTHIVFTNGRQSTVNRYFAFNEGDRPIVVGAAWIKACRDSAKQLDETKYLVDMEDYRDRSRYSSFGPKRKRKSFFPVIDSEDIITTVDPLDGKTLPLTIARRRRESYPATRKVGSSRLMVKSNPGKSRRISQ
ncbi:hypothetical protein D9757_010359 [Collybiopsis confluens]|uniref:BRCT domain-containing protein n=1 Tax=Collybiopsis confluens TaxID=2823264 RepID=A0A8H5GN71_9AGAR|nr:hypothetical protein D9757_011563 [Collybiopsis confluens]KAF5367825.1 hypothetical protein D9757_010359 [Collybiopsis confluens]